MLAVFVLMACYPLATLQFSMIPADPCPKEYPKPTPDMLVGEWYLGATVPYYIPGGYNGIVEQAIMNNVATGHFQVNVTGFSTETIFGDENHMRPYTTYHSPGFLGLWVLRTDDTSHTWISFTIDHSRSFLNRAQ
ncbi:hypothetical protein L9F63_021120 [Diploptera punctata]|uniref:Uncharacterized protein n=1 Tax=Diploptera punctata TaxID=6984 RepID=A0AAD7ZPM4_DIPPU|nr:hypothetical protein L9F63_021120 [Diploptera punctata]